MKSETLTFLRADKAADGYIGRYCKMFNNAGEGLPVTKPTRHLVHTVEVSDLKGAMAALEARRRKPVICYIRGQLREGAPDSAVRRRLENFEDTPRHLVCVDVDGVLVDDVAADWQTDPGEFIRGFIRAHLPAAMHDAACYWYWSSSHMMPGKPGYRMHLWFWSADPLTSFEVKQWWYRQGWSRDEMGRVVLRYKVDLAIYNPVQPHIIAKPVFIGRYDPADGSAPDRNNDSGYLPGSAVDLSPDEFLDQDPPDGIVNVATWEAAGEHAGAMSRKKAPRNTPIGFVNTIIDIEEALEQAGYVNAGRGRFLYPGSMSGVPGVIVKDGHCMSFHSEDPLCMENSHRAWSDAYDVLVSAALEEYGDVGGESYRQTHALEDVANLALSRARVTLNEHLGVLVGAGKISVGMITPDPLWPDAIDLRELTISDMRLYYKNRPGYRVRAIQGDDGEWVADVTDVSLFDEWLAWDDESGKRREWIGKTFNPDGAPENLFNSWTGWPVKGRPGDWSLYRRLILEGICAGNATLFEWVLDWMAVGIQQPTARYGTALVMRGGQGVGKGEFMKWYGRGLFQQYYAATAKGKLVMGDFNSLAGGKLLVFLDEAVYGGDKKESGAWKNMITEEFLTVQRKYQDAVEVRNHSRYVVSTNEEWAAPSGANERRVLALDVDPVFMRDYSFFAALTQQMESGGLEGLMYDLQHRKITTNQREVPRTGMLHGLIQRNFHPHESWLAEVIEEGRFLRREHASWELSQDDAPPAQYLNGSVWPIWVNPGAVHDDYVRWCVRNRKDRYMETRKQLMTWLGKVLRAASSDWGARYGPREKCNGANGYQWPSRDKLLSGFETVCGTKLSEHDIDDDWLD